MPERPEGLLTRLHGGKRSSTARRLVVGSYRVRSKLVYVPHAEEMWRVEKLCGPLFRSGPPGPSFITRETELMTQGPGLASQTQWAHLWSTEAPCPAGCPGLELLDYKT